MSLLPVEAVTNSPGVPEGVYYATQGCTYRVCPGPAISWQAKWKKCNNSSEKLIPVFLEVRSSPYGSRLFGRCSFRAGPRALVDFVASEKRAKGAGYGCGLV